MSKMTVADENGAEHWTYQHMKFVEFLEYVCRVAHLKYQGSAMDGVDLSQKLETLLDEVFLAILGPHVKRRDPANEGDDEIPDDSDY